ncbi:uncharacterized protein STEHIDRAFT_69037, partial [Stereum hirsutum FP-91666 SS1]
FLRSLWPAVTFNLGRSVFTRIHRDFNNLVWSMCAIYALGDYDPKKGGHLILWDWKLVVEFPPGCAILIPSAAVAHGNIAVRPWEIRKSFTQYCPGGLMRWFRYGCRTEENFEKQDYAGWKAMKASAEQRWVEACSMFSTIAGLRKDIIEHLRFADEGGAESVDENPGIAMV